MRAADYLVDIGRGAGVNGGNIIAAGTPQQVIKNKDSLTGQYLSGKKKIPVPKKRRTGNGMMIGGGAGLLLGVLMMVDAYEGADRCGNEDYGCNDEEFLEFFTGYGVAIAGGVVFGVGVTLKIVGGAKLRRAARYRESLERYNSSRLQALEFRLEPSINPYNGSYGSKLSLSF
jgi:hypothetical protein